MLMPEIIPHAETGAEAFPQFVENSHLRNNHAYDTIRAIEPTPGRSIAFARTCYMKACSSLT